jgi:thiamine phosphate synthase YjbQ (UPF0047 family)
MAVYKETIKLVSHGGTPTFVNITPQVKEAIANSGIQNGIVTVISPHTTCSVFFEEYVHDVTEDGTEFLQVDLNNALSKIFPDQTEMPPEGPYMYPGEAHFVDVESWPNAADYLPGGDRRALLNADAHLKSTLIGSSATLEVDEGKLGVGSTGYVYFVDFDRAKGRNRKCKIIIIGE